VGEASGVPAAAVVGFGVGCDVGVGVGVASPVAVFPQALSSKVTNNMLLTTVTSFLTMTYSLHV